MSAPAAPNAMRPDKLERTLLARLGLDPSATPEDLSAAHQAVSAYLAAAPRSLRAWARVQASGADEAYALLTDPVALSRAVALDGTGTRSAARPGEPATPPARREPQAVGPVAVVPAATGDPAPAWAISPAVASATSPAPRVDENGRRIVSDDEIDALLAEVDPTAHREIVGTAAERSASSQSGAAAGGASRPGRLLGIVSSNAFRNLALVGATVSAIVMVAVFGFNAGGTNAGSISASSTPASNAAASAPALDQAAVAALMVKIQANPKDADALMSLGDEYYKTGDFTTAGDWFAKVTEGRADQRPRLPRARRERLQPGRPGDGRDGLEAGRCRSTTRTSRRTTTSASSTSTASRPTWPGSSANGRGSSSSTRTATTAKTVKAHLDAFASASAAPASPGRERGAGYEPGRITRGAGRLPGREPGPVREPAAMTVGAGIGLLVAFMAGVVSFASPCCLPLVPAYVGYMVGATGAADRRRSLFHGLAFVTGFTLVFVAFWASIGAIGYALADNAKYLRQLGGVVLIVIGLQVAGVINVRALWRDTRPMPAFGGAMTAAAR